MSGAEMTQADILSEVVAPDRPGLTEEAARSILSLRFSRSAQERIRNLLAANNRGTIAGAQLTLSGLPLSRRDI